MGLEIRPGRHDDLDEVLAIWAADDVEPTITDDADSLRQLCAHDPAALLVATDGDRIVGTVIATWDGWRGSMWRLAVTADQRRQGIAQALVAHAEDQLRRRGAQRIALFVATTDDAPADFWTAVGYEPQRDRRRLVKNLVPDGDRDGGQHLSLVTIVVDDYDAAIGFFVEVLGFDLVEDTPAHTNDGRPKRWVVVRPPGAATGILLARADGERQAATVGRQVAGRVGFFLRVDDFDAAYRRLTAAGVEFVREPRDEPYGRVAVFVDIAGNRWDLLG